MFKTEIETLLSSTEAADFISVAAEISLDDYNRLSDFEKFVLVCECSDMLLGSRIIERFFDMLSEQKTTAASLKNRCEQNRIWRAIHGDNDANSSIALQSENPSVNYYKSYVEREYIDITEYILKSAKNTSDTLDKCIETLCNTNINAFEISSDNFEYLRPNDYYTQIIYQKISSGEKCKNSDIGALVSYVICCVGKKKKCYVRFFANDKIFELNALAELFEKRNSDVEISVCFDPFSCNLSEDIFNLMLSKGKKISSEIIIPEDVDADSVCNCLKDLLKTIPFSRIRPAYAELDAKFKSAIENNQQM